MCWLRNHSLENRTGEKGRKGRKREKKRQGGGRKGEKRKEGKERIGRKRGMKGGKKRQKQLIVKYDIEKKWRRKREGRTEEENMKSKAT